MKSFHSLTKLFFTTLLCTIILNSSIKAQVIPSDEWINFYSRNTLFHGGLVPVGAVIDAYDPDSIHCGTFTVTTAGEYGFLVVYRDDALTPDVDEGAAPGDPITFKINGVPVKALGPDSSIWTEKGDIVEVDLADNLSPTIADSINDIVMKEDHPDTVIADLDTIFFDPDNDSLIYSTQTNVVDVNAIIDNENRITISLAANWNGEAILILTAQDVWFTVKDTILVQVLPINDPPVIIDLPDTSFSSDTTLVLDLNKYVDDVDHPKSSLHWTAEVQPLYEDSLLVEINDTTKFAIFTSRYIFSGIVKVVFTVTDDSSASDQDTISVQVNLPSRIEDDLNFHNLKTYSLGQNYPNPFNTTTTIDYQLPTSSHVTLKVYNSLGQQVVILVDEPRDSGYYTTFWDASEQASGVYFMWLEAGDFFQMRKMLLLR